jgi:hypothetical protein
MPDLAPPDDLALAAVPASVRAAAAAVGAAGFFGFAHALQIFASVRVLRSPFDLLPPVIGALAVVVLASAAGFARARRWAPLPAVVASSLLFATTSFWFLFALFNGLFTLFGMLVPGLSVIAIVFAVVGRKPCLVTADARRRLEEEGLELGV